MGSTPQLPNFPTSLTPQLVKTLQSRLLTREFNPPTNYERTPYIRVEPMTVRGAPNSSAGTAGSKRTALDFVVFSAPVNEFIRGSSRVILRCWSG
eukprot:1450308-Pyramimonas_sp.AAC.1